MDSVPKLLMVILIGTLVYGSLRAAYPPSRGGMMGAMSGSAGWTGAVPLIIGVLAATLASLFFFRSRKADERREGMKAMLSSDEQTLLNAVEGAGEITQDSLRFRLDWSKAKVSAVLTNLDRRGLVQRERTGKTYKVLPKRNSV